MRNQILLALVAATIPAVSCSKPSPPPSPTTPEVQVVTVEPEDVPIYGEWIGTLDGLVNAEIKAQVSGYLLKRLYQEGSFVREGQALFEIDPRPFQATVDQAKARLSQAEGQLAKAQSELLAAQAQVLLARANEGKASLDVNRYTPLAKEKAITEQQLDNAVQAKLASEAQVKAAEAGLATAQASIQAAEAAIEVAKAQREIAQLNLGFTRIVSPIDGIAGLARAQVGDLVSPESQSLTTVSTVNPIKVYFTVSEQEYLRYRRMHPDARERQASEQKLELELILADGSHYPHPGRFYVADREVNVQTGSIRLAALFPNPGNILRPGQYGRVRALTELRKGALLLPQRAVTELQGSYQVALVDDSNRIQIQPIQVGERTGSMWIVEQGLKPGQRVVAEGTQKVAPDMLVSPKAFVAQAVSEEE